VEEATAFWQFTLSQTTMGRPFAIGPEVPSDRLAALRAAFDAMVKDPQFVAEAAKSHLDLAPISGQAVELLIKQAAAVPKETLEKLKTEINYKGDTITAPPQP
jgi:tripartite-type tricarboxylate transporter receptor subunit TctC